MLLWLREWLENTTEQAERNMAGNGSVSASWDIGLPEGEFLIEFEHGTTSGKRILRINGQVGVFPHYLTKWFLLMFCLRCTRKLISRIFQNDSLIH